MLKNFFKITLRNLRKNKLFVFINVFGMGIALACCIVAYLNWDYNVRFDTHHENAGKIYRVNFIRVTNGQPVKNGSCPLPLGQQIKESISQVGEVMRYFPVGGNFKVENEVFRTWVAAVDAPFLQTFTFDMIAGDAAQLQDKRSIFISEELARKYFPGQPNPVGRAITYINGEKKIEFQVGGVFAKPPQNTSFAYIEAYLNYDNAKDIDGFREDDWARFNTTFVTVDDPGDVPQVEAQLQQYVEIQNMAKQDYKVAEYYLDSFAGMAIRAEREGVWNHWFQQSLPTPAAVAPGIMALLLLLIACFNFTNTSIAIANRRIKEIGIRKVLGSTRPQLIAQFFGENILLTFLALIVGLAIAAFLVPAYSQLWAFLDIRMNLLENMGLIGFMGGLLLFTALIAGSYPAFYVSAFQPTTILRGSVKFSGTNMLTRILLTLQYAISLIAIISGFIFAQNANYQNNYDFGFDMKSVVYAFVKDEQGYAKMRNELMGYDVIKEIAGSAHSISTSWYTDPIKVGEEELDVSILDVGAGYLSTVGATLLEGRDFRENSQTDAERSVIINEQLARTLGWDNPIGQRIVLRDTIALSVIGLVKDIYIDASLWEPLEPMLMRYTPRSNFRYLTARADLSDVTEVKKLMDEKWRAVFPDELSTVNFMEEEKAESAEVNHNIKLMFIFLGVVAVVLSAIGLFSLVSLNLIKRMKEIGVRKVLGASIGSLSMRVSKEFIIILSIASVLGSAAGYYLADMLMASIWAYYVPIHPLVFVLSITILFVISGLTIGGKVVKAASVNPAYILRDE